MPQIKVHEKALAHLSRGLYRSPASAIRELVSNAWDANATVVRINTNFPVFFQLSVEDDGDGFTQSEFVQLMEGGIGNSQKREQGRTLINGRNMIGRLGIGMLGIAQICGSFTITSKTRNGQGFTARVRLYDLLKERLDSSDSAVVREEGERVVEVNVGEYEFLKFDDRSANIGTRILADGLHPMFVRTFQKSLEFERYKDPPLAWDKVLNIVKGVHSLQQLGDYWRFMWELAASCPLPYLNKNALPNNLVGKDQARLESYDFAVILDGRRLAKPVLLRGNPGGYTAERLDEVHDRVYAKPLSFHGYIIVQEGAQLRPDELRGILIRIKDVAIGYYDPSMLDYRFNEGPRSRWLTGEIYVNRGLEDALNVDRDSFNRFHPEYKRVQEYVHDVLHGKVFTEVYKQIKKRSNERQDAQQRNRREELKEVIETAVESPVQLSFKRSERLPHVVVEEMKGGIRVTAPEPESLKTKKSNRQLAASLLTIFEVAMLERSREKQREVFTELLLDLLARW